jgi:hypothetical protein
MLDTTEIAYAKFLTTKEKGEFVYEMRLVQLDLTSEYILQRRWFYSNDVEQPTWRKSDDWNLGDRRKFIRKFIQKRDIMKFNLVESRGLDVLELN